MSDDDTPHTPAGELATVHQLRLPVRDTPPTVDAGEVCDGEIVEDDRKPSIYDGIYDDLDLTRQRDRAIARRRGYVADARLVVHVVRVVVTHRHTRRTGAAVLRHILYLAGGTRIIVQRILDARTHSMYARAIRTAQATGQYEQAIEWHDRGEKARQDRHARKMEKIRTSGQRLKKTFYTLIKIVGGLVGVGVVEWVITGRFAKAADPFVAVADTVHIAVIAFTIGWLPVLLIAPSVTLVTLWDIGRRRTEIPAWVAPPKLRAQSGGEPITPSIVVKALRELGIAGLRKKIDAMEDGGASLLGPISMAGCGVEVDILLPLGATTTSEVQSRRRRLAENLTRHEREVHIAIAPAARTVRVWIADPGALDEPVGPSPLVIDPTLTADIYTGRAPWGRNLRDDAVAISLLQCHLLITGKSKQGKSASLRALALWAALDPTVELWIADLKGIGDWHMFEGLANVLIEGPSDKHACAATEMLERAVVEMERRLGALDPDEYPDGVTRELASKPGSGFHTLIVIVDEAQNAYMNPLRDDEGNPYGGKSNRSRYFMAVRKTHNQGRAVNMLLWEGTQDPTDLNLPKMAREGAHIRACLYVGTEEQAKMGLGDHAVAEGAAPHKLRDGLDKGTLVVTGEGVPLPPGQPSITVRTHFINGTDATKVAARIKERRHKHVETRTAAVLETPPRDFLADLATALDDVTRVKPVVQRKAERDWRIRSAVALRWLGEDWPEAYGAWGSQKFAAALAEALPHIEEPIHQGRTADGGEGQRYVDIREVMAALADRGQQAEEGDETEDIETEEED